MTLLEQLATLARQFPRSKELAVSPEQGAEYEEITVALSRHMPHTLSVVPPLSEVLPLIGGGHLTVESSTFAYRDRRLVVVRSQP